MEKFSCQRSWLLYLDYPWLIDYNCNSMSPPIPLYQAETKASNPMKGRAGPEGSCKQDNFNFASLSTPAHPVRW